MTGIIAWPVIAFMTLVLVGRYRWCNSNLYEKYFNNTLTFLLLTQLLREHLVQNMLVSSAFMAPPGTWQLSTAVMIYSYGEFMGFTLLWSGMSEAEARRKHKYYRLAGVLLAAGVLIFGSPARIAAEPLEFTVGWESVAGLACVSALLVVLATRMIWLSVRELRTASSRRERLIAISTLSIGLAGMGSVIQEVALQMSDQLGWTHTAEFRQQYHAFGIFFMIFGVFATAAVPLATKLRRSLGLDPISRSWSTLQPLRRTLRTVVPECVFALDHDEPRRRKTQLQLHHTVVEIRDAMLGLRPYFREIPNHELMRFLAKPHPVPARDRDTAVAALRLAYAARAKAAGVTPEPPDVDSALIVASRAATLQQEAAELTMLAKWWPAAYAATEDIIEFAADKKASPTL
ncbi:MAB_1171c family putative transporter [Mycobacterium sp. 852002-40037_SCH5390672]|uniref:MAB_1171c family putative transporter n=1 Tax=Mycobacterium sp. 852002-40037_SCH5390672 TaxID=1834089 RepID=UPI000ABA1D42|nr:MAB_1171c family putative transporter [Mycobacterium sp. 852002-40037_SCH5390672]